MRSDRRFELVNYPFYLMALYALIYMSNAIYGTFVPVYLESIGYEKTQIGTLLALGPFVAILAQPVWGIVGDRANTKNSVLKVLILGSAVAVLMHPISHSFYYLLFIMVVFTFFKTPIGPISDTIALESLENTSWRFGPIRMAGTIGYAIMAVIAGGYAKRSITGIFLLYFLIALPSFFIIFRLPRVRGHQSEGNRMPVWKLFKNRELVLLMGFSGLIQITLGFYYSFFSLYFKELGGDNALLGWAMFISAVSEIPFLIFADKILKKIGTRYALLGSAFFMAVRWIILYTAVSPAVVLASQVLHGLNFIVLQYSMAIYINQEVPKELKASGQAMNGLIGMGISRIIGSLAGGVISDRIGIGQVYLYNGLLVFSSVLLFGFFFIKNSYKKKHAAEKLG